MSKHDRNNLIHYNSFEGYEDGIPVFSSRELAPFHEDIHKKNASIMLNTSIDEVTDAQRKRAKERLHMIIWSPDMHKSLNHDGTFKVTEES